MALLRLLAGRSCPWPFEQLLGPSHNAQSPVSLATTRKYTTTTTSKYLGQQPTKRLRNDQTSKQPQNHRNDPNRPITINPSHTNTSSQSTTKINQQHLPSPPPPPRPPPKATNALAPAKQKGQRIAYQTRERHESPQQKTQPPRPVTTTKTQIVTIRKQWLSWIVRWEGSWRGVGDVSSLTGAIYCAEPSQPGRGNVPRPPTYIHDVLRV